MKSINLYFFSLLTLLIIRNQVFAQAPKLVLPVGHTKAVLSSDYIADGQKIITQSADGTVKLWDAGSNSLLMDFIESGDASRGAIIAARLAGDGKKLALSFGTPTDTKIVDIHSGKELWSRLYNHLDVPGIDIMKHFSPDGKRIILFDSENTATVYSTETVTPVFVLRGHKGNIYKASYSPDGKRIVTASGDSTLKIWDARTAKTLITKKQSDAVTSLLFSADSKYILISTENNSAKILNGITGGLISTLDGFEPDSVNAENSFSYSIPESLISTDGKLVLQLSNSGSRKDEDNLYENYCTGINESLGESLISYYDKIKVWDIQSGKLLYTLDSLVEYNTNYNFVSPFNPDGKKIITISKDHKVQLRDAATGKILFLLAGHKGIINAARFSRDGKTITTASMDSTAKTWDTKTGKLIFTFSGHTSYVTDSRFSPDNKNILTSSADQTTRIWDAISGKQTGILKGQTNSLAGARFNSDGTKIIFYSTHTRKKLDLRNFTLSTLAENSDDDSSAAKVVQPFPANQNNMDSLHQSILTEADINRLQWRANWQVSWAVDIFTVWDGDLSNTIVNERLDALISNIVFSPDKRKLLFTLDNNTIRLYDIEKKRFLLTFVDIDSTNYILRMPSGYYQGTPNASKLLHYVTDDLKVISFEQLDVKYNRPDLVLKAIENSDTALINAYHHAYIKRIKKLGLDTTAFRDGYGVPEADFVNRDNISSEQKSEMLTLRIKGIDNTYKPDRFNLWINEVPLFGIRGINIKNRKNNNLDTSITISLSEGNNKIETSVTNVNGTESYRMPLSVKYIPQTTTPAKVYFIGIGINEFSDNSYNLNWCVQDIRDLTKTMQIKYGSQFKILDTLYNQNVTLSNIKLLKQKLINTGINDKVIISYSGHGLLSKDYDYYLSSYNVNFDKPGEAGIPYDAIENLLDSIPARQKILLLDACNSGEVDKEELQKINSSNNELAKNKITISPGNKGIIVTNTAVSAGKLGLQNSFELMQNLFVNVGKGTGAIIISAAGGVQFAQERSELGHGVFTYSVIEAMKNNDHMKVSEFKKYIGNRVLELTNGLQKPTTRNETIAVDWNVW